MLYFAACNIPRKSDMRYIMVSISLPAPTFDLKRTRHLFSAPGISFLVSFEGLIYRFISDISFANLVDRNNGIYVFLYYINDLLYYIL